MERPGEGVEDELRAVELFAALDPHQLQIVIGATRVVRLGDGGRLFDRGQPARQFFFLRSGQLKLFHASRHGDEKIIEIVRPGETFAEAVMLSASAMFADTPAVSRCHPLSRRRNPTAGHRRYSGPGCGRRSSTAGGRGSVNR